MHGLYLLWWVQERQIPPALVASVLAAGDLAVMLCEVPTGWFADRVGCRASLIIGSCMQVLGMLACWLLNGIPGLLIGTFLVAFGDAFRSGADTALLYRSCVLLERTAAFQSIVARAHAVTQGALVLLVIAGGVLVARWGFVVGWIVDSALCGLGLVLALLMVEPARESAVHAEGGAADRPARGMLPRMVFLSILPVALVGAAADASSFLAQTAEHAMPGANALLVALITCAEAVGALAAMRLTSAGTRELATAGLMGTMLVAIGLSVPHTLALVACALSFVAGVADPIREAVIQRMASDGMRARAASLASACDMALTTIALPLAGIARTRRRPA